MFLVLATADESGKYAFDAVKENTGMVVVAIIILVTWLAFRRMLQLSERSAKNPKPPEGK